MSELQREEITARIKQARKEAGLTQADMADLLNVTNRTYQNYEADRVPWKLIAKIADVTGKSARWLLHGDTPDLMGSFENGDREMLPVMNVKLDRIEGAISELRKDLRSLRADAADAGMMALLQASVDELREALGQ